MDILNDAVSKARYLTRKKADLSKTVILSNNCIAGFLYHDYQQQFLSPTINLQIAPSDFIRFCNDLDGYDHQDMTEISREEYREIFPEKTTPPFPVAHLSDILVYFQHYSDFNEARETWNRRSGRMVSLMQNDEYRINLILMTDRYDNELYTQWTHLNFSRKIYLYSDGPDSAPEGCFALQIPSGRQWYEYSLFPVKRYYDQFDFSEWFR